MSCDHGRQRVEASRAERSRSTDRSQQQRADRFVGDSGIGEHRLHLFEQPQAVLRGPGPLRQRRRVVLQGPRREELVQLLELELELAGLTSAQHLGHLPHVPDGDDLHHPSFRRRPATADSRCVAGTSSPVATPTRGHLGLT